MKELKEAIAESNKFRMIYPIDKLNEHQKVIYEILEKKQENAVWFSLQRVSDSGAEPSC
ncbi:MAG: hypothetical protein QXU99_00980 [Candidatus Bathyarchaeia archaeon]